MDEDEGIVELLAVGGDDGGEVSVARIDGLVVLDGPQHLVESLVSASPVLRSEVDVQKSTSMGSALGALSKAVGVVAGQQSTGKQLFELDAKALEMLKAGELVDKGDGWMRLFGMDGEKRFSGHGMVKSVDISPERLMSAQLAMATLALEAAIQDVQEAVERVEAKVELLRDHIEADRVGSVGGLNRFLRRHATRLAENGHLPDGDWSGIDAVAAQIDQSLVTIEAFINKRLAAVENEGSGIGDRVDALNLLADLGEALTLLLVAEDNQLVFEQLRLHRIRAADPDRFEAAVRASVELIADQRAGDRELIDRVRHATADRVGVHALEIHRILAIPELQRVGLRIDQHLGDFAGRRRLPYEPIETGGRPSVGDAAAELRDRGASAANASRTVARRAAVGGRRAVAGLAARVRRTEEEAEEERPALEEGVIAYELPPPRSRRRSVSGTLEVVRRRDEVDE